MEIPSNKTRGSVLSENLSPRLLPTFAAHSPQLERLFDRYETHD